MTQKLLTNKDRGAEIFTVVVAGGVAARAEDFGVEACTHGVLIYNR